MMSKIMSGDQFHQKIIAGCDNFLDDPFFTCPVTTHPPVFL